MTVCLDWKTPMRRRSRETVQVFVNFYYVLKLLRIRYRWAEKIKLQIKVKVEWWCQKLMVPPTHDQWIKDIILIIKLQKIRCTQNNSTNLRKYGASFTLCEYVTWPGTEYILVVSIVTDPFIFFFLSLHVPECTVLTVWLCVFCLYCLFFLCGLFVYHVWCQSLYYEHIIWNYKC